MRIDDVMDQLSSGLALLLVSVAVILRLDGFLMIWMRRERLVVISASLLDLLSPVLCMLMVSYVSGKGYEERRMSKGAVVGTLEMCGAFLVAQLLTGFTFAALLFILGEDLPAGRAVGPWSVPSGFLPLYLLFIISWSGAATVCSLRLLRPELDLRRSFEGSKLLSGSLLAMVSLPVVMALSYLVIRLASEAGLPGNADLFSDPEGPMDVGYLVFGIAMIAPLVEEMMFRGYLYSLLERRAGTNPAIIVTAWLFALFHFSFVSFIPIFFMGLWMGYLRKRSGSILPSLIFHGLNNLMAIVIILL
jgi:membrane protease YdiL (CAAX protease family)